MKKPPLQLPKGCEMHGRVRVAIYKGFKIDFHPTEAMFEVREGATLESKSFEALTKKIDDVARIEYEPVPAIMLSDGIYSSPGAKAKLHNISVVAPDIGEHKYKPSDVRVWVKHSGKRELVQSRNLIEASDEAVAKIDAWRELRIAADEADKVADAAWDAIPRAKLPVPKQNPEAK